MKCRYCGKEEFAHHCAGMEAGPPLDQDTMIDRVAEKVQARLEATCALCGQRGFCEEIYDPEAMKRVEVCRKCRKTHVVIGPVPTE